MDERYNETWQNINFTKEDIQVLENCVSYIDESDFYYKGTIDYAKAVIYDLKENELEWVQWIDGNLSNSKHLVVVKFGNTDEHNYAYLVYDKKLNKVVGSIPNK